MLERLGMTNIFGWTDIMHRDVRILNSGHKAFCGSANIFYSGDNSPSQYDSMPRDKYDIMLVLFAFKCHLKEYSHGCKSVLSSNFSILKWNIMGIFYESNVLCEFR